MKKILLLILLIFISGCSQNNIGADFIVKEAKFEKKKLKAPKEKILNAVNIDNMVEVLDESGKKLVK